jgi:hypothetical protein
MALPPTPDAVASYWGADPTQAPANDEARIRGYWGEPINAAVPTGDPASALTAGLTPATPAPTAATAPAGADIFSKAAADMAPHQLKGVSTLSGMSSPADGTYNNFDPSQVTGFHPLDPNKSLAPAKEKASDDAAFQAYMAKNAPATPAKPASAAGVGVRGPAKATNPDPYGVDAARKAQLGTFDTRKGALEHAAVAEEDQTVMRAEHMGNLARMQEEDAAIARSEADFAQRKFDDDMGEINRQLADVKSKKVDPLRMMKDSPALGFLAVIGGIVGGMYQGATGGKSNQFLDDLNRQIDRDIAEQERQIKDERSAVGEKAGLLQQLRLSQKDKATADLQYRNMAYEAAKTQIMADAEKAGTPIARAHAEDASAQLTFTQKELQAQLAERKQAAALAAAAGAHKNDREVQKTYMDLYKHLLSSGSTPAQAEAEARRAVGVMYLGNAGPRDPSAASSDALANVPKELRIKAAEEVSAHATAEKSITAVGNSFNQLKNLPATAGPWDRDRDALNANILAAYKAGLGPGMSSDKDAEKFLEPLIPSYTDSAATVARKQALIAQSIRSKVATPLLDNYSPGWRPKTTEEAKAALGAKPVR